MDHLTEYSKLCDLVYSVSCLNIKNEHISELHEDEYNELNYDDSNYHKNNKRPVKTASISQARQPIYSSSVNSGDNYKEYLKEMFENLI